MNFDINTYSTLRLRRSENVPSGISVKLIPASRLKAKQDTSDEN